MVSFYDVSVVLPYAKAITWDTCHKIYVLMDDAQVEQMRGYGYGEDEPDSFFTSKEMTVQEMLTKLEEWYSKSCGLRFIQSIRTVEGDANEGFEDLIEQGADWDEDEDEDY